MLLYILLVHVNFYYLNGLKVFDFAVPLLSQRNAQTIGFFNPACKGLGYSHPEHCLVIKLVGVLRTKPMHGFSPNFQDMTCQLFASVEFDL